MCLAICGFTTRSVCAGVIGYGVSVGRPNGVQGDSLIVGIAAAKLIGFCAAVGGRPAGLRIACASKGSAAQR